MELSSVKAPQANRPIFRKVATEAAARLIDGSTPIILHDRWDFRGVPLPKVSKRPRREASVKALSSFPRASVGKRPMGFSWEEMLCSLSEGVRPQKERTDLWVRTKKGGGRHEAK